jgi:hypothetical protein
VEWRPNKKKRQKRKDEKRKDRKEEANSESTVNKTVKHLVKLVFCKDQGFII